MHDTTIPPYQKSIIPDVITELVKGGRPTLMTAEMVASICDVIRRTGISDSAAALRVEIGVSTLSRWKKENEGLVTQFGAAREQYRSRKLQVIDEAVTKDGRPDWRAAAWALEKAFPEDYGRSRHKSPRSAGAAAEDADPNPIPAAQTPPAGPVLNPFTHPAAGILSTGNRLRDFKIAHELQRQAEEAALRQHETSYAADLPASETDEEPQEEEPTAAASNLSSEPARAQNASAPGDHATSGDEAPSAEQPRLTRQQRRLQERLRHKAARQQQRSSKLPRESAFKPLHSVP